MSLSVILTSTVSFCWKRIITFRGSIKKQYKKISSKMIIHRNIEAVKDNHMSVLLLPKGFLHFLEGERSIFIFF